MFLMFTFSKKSFLKALCILILASSMSSCEQIKRQVGLGGPKDIPLGEYVGTAKLMTISEKKEADKEVKISFLPKEPGFKDAIGVLVFNNTSDRFLWRSDGNNNNIWNIMFAKDNTIYSSLQDSFEFSGIIKASDVRNTLEGKFTRIFEEEEFVYYFTASQVFKPEIITPEAPIAVKAGEEITISTLKIDPEKTKVFIAALEAEDQGKAVPITNSVLEKDVYLISFASSKDLSKGKYKVTLERDDGEKSKPLVIEIK